MTTAFVIGANWHDIRGGRQPTSAAINEAFASVQRDIPAGFGRWLGRARITRLPPEAGATAQSLGIGSGDANYWTRAVSVWVAPDTQAAQQFARQYAEQASAMLLERLSQGGAVAGWESRPIAPYYPETHGDPGFWASGQAAQTRTQEPLTLSQEFNEAGAEQADGPGRGTTAGEVVQQTAGEVSRQAQESLSAWASRNWHWLLGGAVILGGALYFYMGQRRNPAPRELELPNPEDFDNVWDNPTEPFENPCNCQLEENPSLPGLGQTLGGFADALGWMPQPMAEPGEVVQSNPLPPGSNPHPREWDVLRPGTAYACKSKQLGRTIKRGRFSDFLVDACATPVPTTAKEARRKKTPGPPAKQGAFIIKQGRKGIPIAVRGSVVREGLRPDRGQVGEAPPGGADGIRAGAAEMRRSIAAQKRAGAYFPEPPGLPYPARPGSSVCLPGSAPWQALEEATNERAALLDADGVPLTREILSEALRGDPAFREAAAIENECIEKYWERAARARAPKATLSTARETALRREQAKREGVDLSSSEWTDTLEGQQSAIARKQRSKGSTKKAGRRSNPHELEAENPRPVRVLPGQTALDFTPKPTFPKIEKGNQRAIDQWINQRSQEVFLQAKPVAMLGKTEKQRDFAEAVRAEKLEQFARSVAANELAALNDSAKYGAALERVRGVWNRLQSEPEAKVWLDYLRHQTPKELYAGLQTPESRAALREQLLEVAPQVARAKIAENPWKPWEEALSYDWTLQRAQGSEAKELRQAKKTLLERMPEAQRARYEQEKKTWQKEKRAGYEGAPSAVRRREALEQDRESLAEELSRVRGSLLKRTRDAATKDAFLDALDGLREGAGVGYVHVEAQTGEDLDLARSFERAQALFASLETQGETEITARSFEERAKRLAKIAAIPSVAAVEAAQEKRAREIEAAMAAREAKKKALPVIETERRGRHGLPGQTRLPGINPRVVVRFSHAKR